MLCDARSLTGCFFVFCFWVCTHQPLASHVAGQVLREYPAQGICKELIQNADDATAREVVFCLDCRQHSTDKLPSPSMAPFQGPALLAYNSAVFTDTVRR